MRPALRQRVIRGDMRARCQCWDAALMKGERSWDAVSFDRQPVVCDHVTGSGEMPGNAGGRSAPSEMN